MPEVEFDPYSFGSPAAGDGGEPSPQPTWDLELDFLPIYDPDQAEKVERAQEEAEAKAWQEYEAELASARGEHLNFLDSLESALSGPVRQVLALPFRFLDPQGFEEAGGDANKYFKQVLPEKVAEAFHLPEDLGPYKTKELLSDVFSFATASPFARIVSAFQLAGKLYEPVSHFFEENISKPLTKFVAANLHPDENVRQYWATEGDKAWEELNPLLKIAINFVTDPTTVPSILIPALGPGRIATGLTTVVRGLKAVTGLGRAAAEAGAAERALATMGWAVKVGEGAADIERVGHLAELGQGARVVGRGAIIEDEAGQLWRLTEWGTQRAWVPVDEAARPLGRAAVGFGTDEAAELLAKSKIIDPGLVGSEPEKLAEAMALASEGSGPYRLAEGLVKAVEIFNKVMGAPLSFAWGIDKKVIETIPLTRWLAQPSPRAVTLRLANEFADHLEKIEARRIDDPAASRGSRAVQDLALIYHEAAEQGDLMPFRAAAARYTDDVEALEQAFEKVRRFAGPEEFARRVLGDPGDPVHPDRAVEALKSLYNQAVVAENRPPRLGPVSDILDAVNATLKEAWLPINPSYHLRNMLDNAVKAAIHGDLGRVSRSDLNEVLERLETYIPARVEGSFTAGTRPESRGLLGRMPVLGRVIAAGWRVGEEIENFFRRAAFIRALERELEWQRLRFAEELKSQLLNQGADPGVANFVAAKFLEGRVKGPSELRDILDGIYKESSGAQVVLPEPVASLDPAALRKLNGEIGQITKDYVAGRIDGETMRSRLEAAFDEFKRSVDEFTEQVRLGNVLSPERYLEAEAGLLSSFAGELYRDIRGLGDLAARIALARRVGRELDDLDRQYRSLVQAARTPEEALAAKAEHHRRFTAVMNAAAASLADISTRYGGFALPDLSPHLNRAFEAVRTSIGRWLPGQVTDFADPAFVAAHDRSATYEALERGLGELAQGIVAGLPQHSENAQLLLVRAFKALAAAPGEAVQAASELWHKLGEARLMAALGRRLGETTEVGMSAQAKPGEQLYKMREGTEAILRAARALFGEGPIEGAPRLFSGEYILPGLGQVQRTPYTRAGGRDVAEAVDSVFNALEGMARAFAQDLGLEPTVLGGLAVRPAEGAMETLARGLGIQLMPLASLEPGEVVSPYVRRAQGGYAVTPEATMLMFREQNAAAHGGMYLTPPMPLSAPTQARVLKDILVDMLDRAWGRPETSQAAAAREALALRWMVERTALPLEEVAAVASPAARGVVAQALKLAEGDAGQAFELLTQAARNVGEAQQRLGPFFAYADHPNLEVALFGRYIKPIALDEEASKAWGAAFYRSLGFADLPQRLQVALGAAVKEERAEVSGAVAHDVAVARLNEKTGTSEWLGVVAPREVRLPPEWADLQPLRLREAATLARAGFDVPPPAEPGTVRFYAAAPDGPWTQDLDAVLSKNPEALYYADVRPGETPAAGTALGRGGGLRDIAWAGFDPWDKSRLTAYHPSVPVRVRIMAGPEGVVLLAEARPGVRGTGVVEEGLKPYAELLGRMLGLEEPPKVKVAALPPVRDAAGVWVVKPDYTHWGEGFELSREIVGRLGGIKLDEAAIKVFGGGDQERARQVVAQLLERVPPAYLAHLKELVYEAPGKVEVEGGKLFFAFDNGPRLPIEEAVPYLYGYLLSRLYREAGERAGSTGWWRADIALGYARGELPRMAYHVVVPLDEELAARLLTEEGLAALRAELEPHARWLGDGRWTVTAGHDHLGRPYLAIRADGPPLVDAQGRLTGSEDFFTVLQVYLAERAAELEVPAPVPRVYQAPVTPLRARVHRVLPQELLPNAPDAGIGRGLVIPLYHADRVPRAGDPQDGLGQLLTYLFGDRGWMVYDTGLAADAPRPRPPVGFVAGRLVEDPEAPLGPYEYIVKAKAALARGERPAWMDGADWEALSRGEAPPWVRRPEYRKAFLQALAEAENDPSELAKVADRLGIAGDIGRAWLGGYLGLTNDHKGFYILLVNGGRGVYVGESTQMLDRLSKHMAGQSEKFAELRVGSTSYPGSRGIVEAAIPFYVGEGGYASFDEAVKAAEDLLDKMGVKELPPQRVLFIPGFAPRPHPANLKVEDAWLEGLLRAGRLLGIVTPDGKLIRENETAFSITQRLNESPWVAGATDEVARITVDDMYRAVDEWMRSPAAAKAKEDLKSNRHGVYRLLDAVMEELGALLERRSPAAELAVLHYLEATLQAARDRGQPVYLPRQILVDYPGLTEPLVARLRGKGDAIGQGYNLYEAVTGELGAQVVRTILNRQVVNPVVTDYVVSPIQLNGRPVSRGWSTVNGGSFASGALPFALFHRVPGEELEIHLARLVGEGEVAHALPFTVEELTEFIRSDPGLPQVIREGTVAVRVVPSSDLGPGIFGLFAPDLTHARPALPGSPDPIGTVYLAEPPVIVGRTAHEVGRTDLPADVAGPWWILPVRRSDGGFELKPLTREEAKEAFKDIVREELAHALDWAAAPGEIKGAALYSGAMDAAERRAKALAAAFAERPGFAAVGISPEVAGKLSAPMRLAVEVFNWAAGLAGAAEARVVSGVGIYFGSKERTVANVMLLPPDETVRGRLLAAAAWLGRKLKQKEVLAAWADEAGEDVAFVLEFGTRLTRRDRENIAKAAEEAGLGGFTFGDVFAWTASVKDWGGSADELRAAFARFVELVAESTLPKFSVREIKVKTVVINTADESVVQSYVTPHQAFVDRLEEVYRAARTRRKDAGTYAPAGYGERPGGAGPALGPGGGAQGVPYPGGAPGVSPAAQGRGGAVAQGAGAGPGVAGPHAPLGGLQLRGLAGLENEIKQLEAEVNNLFELKLADEVSRAYGPIKQAGLARDLVSRELPLWVEQVYDAAKNIVAGQYEIFDRPFINALVDEWRRRIYRATEAAADHVDHVFFNYQATSRFDEILKVFSPFVVWQTRNIPWYIEHMVQIPALRQAVDKMMAELERERLKQNLTERFEGRVPLPEVVSRALGVRGTVYINPLQTLFSILSQTQEPFIEDDATAVGQVLKWVSAGLGGVRLYPYFEIPLQAAGVYGNQPFGDLLTISRLIRGVLGVDPEGWWKYGLAKAVGMRTITGDPILDAAINRQVAFIVQREKLNPAEGYRAIDNPNHPLWQRAFNEVSREANYFGLLSYLLPVSFKLLTPEEAEFRRKMLEARLHPAQTPAERARVYTETPGLGVYQARFDSSLARELSAQYAEYNAIGRDILDRWARAGYAIEALSPQEQEALARAREARRQYLAEHPLLHTYIIWREERERAGQSRTGIKDFIKELGGSVERLKEQRGRVPEAIAQTQDIRSLTLELERALDLYNRVGDARIIAYAELYSSLDRDRREAWRRRYPDVWQELQTYFAAKDKIRKEHPILEDYFEWLSTRPQGSDRSPLAFIKETGGQVLKPEVKEQIRQLEAKVEAYNNLGTPAIRELSEKYLALDTRSRQAFRNQYPQQYQALKQFWEARDRFLKENPDLKAYFEWRDARGGRGSVRDYVKERSSGQPR